MWTAYITYVLSKMDGPRSKGLSVLYLRHLIRVLASKIYAHNLYIKGEVKNFYHAVAD